MEKIISAIGVVLLVIAFWQMPSGYCETTRTPSTSPKVGQIETTLALNDLGKVPRGKRINRTVSLTNHTAQALVVTDLRSDCSCLRGTFDKRPVRPGATIDLPFVFQSRKRGVFYKVVSVKTSVGNAEIIFKGEVVDQS